MSKEEAIRKKQKNIFKMVTDKFQTYYLTGGTALSFYYEHRFSEDLDFFTQKYDKRAPDMIMEFISDLTGYSHSLEAEQEGGKLVSMKVYTLSIDDDNSLKIDFVQDYVKNINYVKNGLHSIADIYYRKLCIAVGGEGKTGAVGEPVTLGRQSGKDIYDLYFLSKEYHALSDFFLEHFPRESSERLIAWYRRFSRMDLKLELVDLVPDVDTKTVIKQLDEEILQKLPDKLITLGGE